jgi:hypothetical protein
MQTHAALLADRGGAVAKEGHMVSAPLSQYASAGHAAHETAPTP